MRWKMSLVLGAQDVHLSVSASHSLEVDAKIYHAHVTVLEILEIAVAKNVQNTQDQIVQILNASKTTALQESTSQLQELASHVNHAKLRFQDRHHAQPQVVMTDQSSQMTVYARLAEISRNQVL